MATTSPQAQQSLYRKWRPQTFSELKGQDVIRDTLFYAVTNGKMSQAYLFCGPRGTGKTTTARLIAKLVNCIAEGDGRPCNVCASCTTITDGANLDIIEVDAASNRGIDEIRQLRDSVRFMPTQAKHKVYIIDEVHMLTREAFNALLKTLEEPPAHVLFILATTEAHKIPPTIISRCQRYDFRLATLETLAEHLLTVAKQEGMALTPEAAQFIARLGEGSFRDSLSLLDQVRAANKDEYTLEVVEQLFGYIPSEQMSSCLEAVLTGNGVVAHQQVDAALAHGADLRAFCDQLLGLSQRVLEASILGETTGLSPELLAAAKNAGMKRLVGWLELLLDAVGQIKQSPIPRLPLDVAIAKMVSGEVGSAPAPAVASATPAATPAPTSPPVASVAPPAPTSPPVTAPRVAPSAPPAAPIDVAPVMEQTQPVVETVSVPVAVILPDVIQPTEWQSLLSELKKEAPSLVTSLVHARVVGLESDVLKLAVRFKMHADKINQTKNRLTIETILATVMQAPLKVEAVVVKDLPLEENSVDVADVFEFEEA